MTWITAATLAAVMSIAITLIASRSFPGASRTVAHFANADDRPAVMLGKQVYMQRCASCHGRYLQGQPLWQLVDENFHRRAPAHDQTGHTWLHGDEELFFMTKFGHFADVTGASASAMPGFDGVLNDHEILAAIAFIKARWPVGLRVMQAMRNPGRAGLPADVEHEDWRFPPDCRATDLRAARKRTPSG
jgi:mono/diheme cytochrome c family protein